MGWLNSLSAWFLGIFNQAIARINSFVSDLWHTVGNFFKSLVLTLQDMLKDVVLWLFDQMMSLAIYAIDGMGSLLQGFDISSIVSGLPHEVLNIMGLIGLGQCLGMIAAALTIRLLLQLIPFVRLGS